MDEADINRQKVMQIATSQDGQPWICTVYFVLYRGNFYWLSLPNRRHSKELGRNKKAALAIAMKQTMPVMGLQAEGTVQIVSEVLQVEPVLAAYVEKYNQGRQFVARFKEGKNEHVLYCLTPKKIMLFDETIPGDEPYRKISIDASKLSHGALTRIRSIRRG